MEKSCSQEELDAFVAREIMSDGPNYRIFSSIEEAEDYLSVVIDLEWPDTPYGFETEEFMESYNRQVPLLRKQYPDLFRKKPMTEEEIKKHNEALQIIKNIAHF